MKIGIIGLGLIGGSIGRALVKRTDHTVYAFDRDEGAMLKGELLGAYHERLTEHNANNLDILIIALYPSAAADAMKKWCPHLRGGAIVTDCCGNKRIIADAMRALQKEYPSLRFVAAHPMAGREFSGISHSTANLFDRAYVVIVPVTEDIEALYAVKRMYLDIGAQDVETCSAEKHDEMISYTSQLAHIVSSSYIKNKHSSSHAGFSAGSFRDMTRVAKLNPEMWSELFLQNRDNLIEDISVLMSRLSEYKDALEDGDGERLFTLLKDGVDAKDAAENARKERLKNE